MSWKAEVMVAGETKWHSNGLRFATADETEKYAKDLFSRWTSVKEWRIVEVDDPPTHYWEGSKYGPIPKSMHKFTDANGPGE